MSPDEFGKLLDRKFDEKLKPIENQLGNIENRLSRVERRLSHIERGVVTIKKDIGQLQETQAIIVGEYGAQIKRLEKQHPELPPFESPFA